MMLRSAQGRAAAVVFMAMGVLTGTFSSRWPWIAGRLHMSSAMIGGVGLAATVGALTVMPFAARFVHRYGARASTRVLTAAAGATLVLPAYAPDPAVLALVFVLMGAAIGTQDNAMNTAGVEAERGLGASIMSGLHGMWSVGVLVGALAGSLAAHENLDPRIQFAVMGALIVITGLVPGAWLPGEPAAGPAAEVHVPRFVWPRGLLLMIGLVAFAAIFVEYAANDWSALFMHWTMHASQALAALATGLFALAMAAGRLAGDAVVRRIGAVRSVRACGVLATAGCIAVAASPGAWAALAGFMLIGAGVSVVVPLVFAAAGHMGPSPAAGVAAVATISYGAGLGAPSIMGGVAELSSLRVAFGLATVVAVVIAAGAGLLGRVPRSAPALAAEMAAGEAAG
jgi:MFS family permease